MKPSPRLPDGAHADRTLTVTRVVITEPLQHPRALRGQGWQTEAIQSWLRQKDDCAEVSQLH